MVFKNFVIVLLSLLILTGCEFTEKLVDKGQAEDSSGNDGGENLENGLVDSDGDGLPDSTEEILGTDPDLLDTDGDGLPDGAEVQTHGTNPTLADTDGGGKNDGDEVLDGTNPLDASDDVSPADPDTDDDGLDDVVEEFLGTDPNNPDTDGDGLTDGAEVLTHETSPTNGDTDGGGKNDGDEVNTGTNPLDASDDTPPVDPDADGDGLNNDAEASLGTDPSNPDTDGDGLTDGAEVLTHGTNPTNKDTDGGGKEDGDEINTGTNPLDASDDVPPEDPDKDDDGLEDALELVIGSDPTKPDTDGDGLLDGAEVKTHRTDPTNSDTDGGGKSDGDEVLVGTNPLDASDDAPIVFPDSDDDGLIDAVEAVLGTEIDNPDTDGDGLTDGAEVQTHNTSPLKKDTDGGGVDDGAEVNTGTNPLDASDDLPPPDQDADDDGLSDLTETFIGTDPNDPDTDGDSLTDGAEVKTHFTSPLKKDTDGGGVDDGREIDLGTNPLNASDDPVADPPTIVFVQSPPSETTETTAVIEFKLENFPSVNSIECLIDGEVVRCADETPVRLEGLAVGVHQFHVTVKTDNGNIITTGIQWEIKEVPPVDPCADGNRRRENHRIRFADPNRICEFGQGVNLPKRNGFFQARRIQRAQLDFPRGTVVCNMDVQIPKQKVKYDDDLAVTWNGVALIANGSHILSDNGENMVFDFEAVKGQKFSGDRKFCFGKDLGSKCSIPSTERRGNLELDISSSALSNLNLLFAGRTQHQIDVITTGDNDGSDCQHSGIDIDVVVEFGSAE